MPLEAVGAVFSSDDVLITFGGKNNCNFLSKVKVMDLQSKEELFDTNLCQ